MHSVSDRIVSISQPYIRLIVCGKAAAPVEFGAKMDLILNEKGMTRIEKLSFDAYNESDVLITSRLDGTTRCSIVLSVIVMNEDRICRSLLRLFCDIVFFKVQTARIHADIYTKLQHGKFSVLLSKHQIR